jgi:hypothetical protein
MTNSARNSSVGSWFGLGLAGLAFWACFSLFSEASADTGAAVVPQSTAGPAAGAIALAAPEPGAVLIGFAVLAVAAIWLLAGRQERLW